LLYFFQTIICATDSHLSVTNTEKVRPPGHRARAMPNTITSWWPGTDHLTTTNHLAATNHLATNP